MTRFPPRSATTAAPPAYQVCAPRASDAIGGALRGAFASELRLPEDMTAMLRFLDETNAKQ
jgi:hypothetical protein